ncbi:DUF3048 domain-containing protein [Paenibacillus agricola]|uniref:DUF3048 domain-containing protein n=1 Tax=Paenibacillus agricola TaxID=2716264 RepID=A0ABX0J4J7_9BACL|nr:DUF3048 domain-containing protein [Paenibacillus agricola]NHN29758.1 DUF3048 domain-containing protein [Paenibacillus agricola]
MRKSTYSIIYATMNKSLKYGITFGAALLFLSSCSVFNPAEPVVTTVTPKEITVPPIWPPVQSPAPVPKVPLYVWPLTGMPAPAPSLSRPFMVMVNNAPQARPQSGLSYADVMYEILAEGEITRLVAVYQSKHWDGPIGPIRSIRPYYIDLGKMLDAVPVHAGGSPDAYAQLSAQKLEHMDEITNAGRYFWREPTRKAPHNLYTNIEMLESGIKGRGLREESKTVQTQPTFLAEETVMPGDRLTSVTITFMHNSSVVSYRYNPERRLYLRFIDDMPHIDLSNNEQLTATNLVVIGADHIILDNEGRRDVKLVGSGAGYLFQRDKVQSVEWERAQVQDTFHLTQANQEASFFPGKTHWIVVPNSPTFDEHISISWEQKTGVAQ